MMPFSAADSAIPETGALSMRKSRKTGGCGPNGLALGSDVIM
jgi:hypothetical protein